ncbi:MAG TPA: (2Fe-2S) ferredoxin domain-containing protein [Spirochaetia bacterium]|nr:(2Fe-2S) ferredoxin domain-containing protein [Spirochaetia bacterium]
MAKMTLEDLRKLRESKKKEIDKRNRADKSVQIVVGMGTCGIAAGAKETLDAFLKELDEQNITNVLVKQTGCMGLCHVEPTVEVMKPGMPTIIYGDVNPTIAKAIVERHILKGELINDHIFDRPAADIVQTEKEAK